ncbi:hypothetical protein [Streptomyces sp. NRRL F-5727]|uniref:hypothetical protein n=1 Tax=Streptomyces sp. NRRL F-5727 TaxID=1463871 RepID=UPI000B3079A9|nr:hypothetical protein [Streptomyces sp. NRRL F-5727]
MITIPTEGTTLTSPFPYRADQHAAALQALAVFLVQSEMILASWDSYSDRHTDTDGWPYDDESYGWRKVQRDTQTWRAFEPVRRSARYLLATARFQLQHIAAGDIEPRWPWQLSELAQAYDRLEALRTEWAQTREAMRTSRPTHEEFIDALAERNAEAWGYLDAWATHGHALLDLHAVALKAPAPAPIAVANPAQQPAAGQSAVRR